MSENDKDLWESEEIGNPPARQNAGAPNDGWKKDPNWNPDEKTEEIDKREEILELAAPIQLLWQISILLSATSLGVLIWSYGDLGALEFQATLMLDAVLILALGYGGYKAQELLARSLVLWTGVATVVVASFTHPLSLLARIVWIVFRCVMMLGLIRGANAVSSYHRLLRGPERKDVMWLRQAIYNMRGPVAVALAAGALLAYSSNEFKKAMDMTGADITMNEGDEGSRSGSSAVHRKPKDAKSDDPHGVATEEEKREAAKKKAYGILAEAAASDGQRHGLTANEEGCATEGRERFDKCSRADCRSAALVFLDACLVTAKPEEGYCEAVPKPSDQEGSKSWLDKVCDGWKQPPRAALDPDPKAPKGDPRVEIQAVDCASYFARVQSHCAKAPARRN